MQFSASLAVFGIGGMHGQPHIKNKGNLTGITIFLIFLSA
jgi:hypothetical protein